MAKASSSKKSLVIVESPAKSKTINKYLGSGYEVKASMGHVRDLPSTGINVDIENDFEPTYEIMPGKSRTVSTLKAAAKNCDKLYLATDLDREGEAIAWHLAQILGVPEENTYRVVFNAITKQAIQEAFANPGRIDISKVMAQQARRILDRIVGYKISPLLWKKVARGLSAGRVQSVAVKMIVEREREIKAFVPEEFWLIPAIFTTDLGSDYTEQWRNFLKGTQDAQEATVVEQNKWLAEHNAFEAELTTVAGEKFVASNSQQAQRVYDALQKAAFAVDDIQVKETKSNPTPPFITSTLQQAASNRLGFAAKRTMRIAQQLYEGVDLGPLGSLGLITYMRTDSTHLSPQALAEGRKFIAAKYGEQYLPEKARMYASGKSAQQAHEAIHPTNVELTPDDVRKYLDDEQFKLYDIIWRKFVSSQMESSRWNVTTVSIKADTEIGACIYKVSGRVLVFDGFNRVWYQSSNDQQLPVLKKADKLQAVDIKSEQNFTKPPARYNEASLVKALEKEGIGRPSTYASIISTIQERKYVEQKERKFYPTDMGEVVTDKLNEYFPQVMDIAFTRYMEEQLDKIEEQDLDWIGVLKEFYGPFEKDLEKATEQMKHAKSEITPSEYKCPDCGKDMVYRFGKNGRFLSCSDYPTCKFACPCDKEGKMVEQKVSEHVCPVCGKPMIEKSGRFGKFLGCSDYPNCKTIQKIDKEGNILAPKEPPVPTGIKCYKCKTGELVIRQSKRGPFMGCNKFPRCRTIIAIAELDKLKDLQTQGAWPPATWEEADQLLGRKAGKKTAAAAKTKKAAPTVKKAKKTVGARKKKTDKPAEDA